MNRKVRRTAFIGHRDFLPQDIAQRLRLAVEREIVLGCTNFTMGTHGNFDREALVVCKSLCATYPEIKIAVVVTNLAPIRPDRYSLNENVETVMYEIEEMHYKRRIMASNRQMLDTCDTLICYVRPRSWRSGAAAVRRYAAKKGLKVVNLYQPADD